MEERMPTEFLPLLNSYVNLWAERTPDKVALIQYENGQEITYRKLADRIDQYAQALLKIGINPGDRVAAQLVLSPELVFLMYACFRIGALFATLDIRLKEQEVVEDLKKIDPKAFFFLGDTPLRDFRETGRLVQQKCSSVEILIQVPAITGPEKLLPGARSLDRILGCGAPFEYDHLLIEELAEITTGLHKRTPALIIYTTGTTGPPKPAVICHENVIVQDEIFGRGIALGEKTRILINLPPSHVGCLTACLTTVIYLGGTAVMQRCFEPHTALEAVQRYGINVLAAIPTQFHMLWSDPDYAKFNLSSLDLVVFGGASGDAAFIRKLSQMAPRFATGIGMTETAGFCSFSQPGISVDEMAGQVGRAYPDLAPVTIRRPMQPDRTAGQELTEGELGEICHHPPLVFLGYYDLPEETARAVTKEGILYSGDLGYIKDMGSYKAIYLAGRRKFVIKQSGYNVFPDEVEAHLCSLEGVGAAVVVGVEHELLGEGVFAYVQPLKNAYIEPTQVNQHCRKIASYKRPQHVEIWPSDRPLPLTRSTKIDKGEMINLARQRIAILRATGYWDAAIVGQQRGASLEQQTDLAK
jgi:fatty-acyl-CoA synthase